MATEQTYIVQSDGTKIPRVGLGVCRANDEQQLEDALNIAFETGYRHVDTAYFYKNEHIVGKVVNKWISSGKAKREDFYIVTKLPPFGNPPELVEKYCKESLASLKLDYVDLYLVHLPVDMEYSEKGANFMKLLPSDHLATWKKMEEQVDAGRTKSIGLSNFNIKQIDRVLKNCRIKPVNLQVELHVFMQQKELVKFAQDNGITVVAYAPLGTPGVNRSQVITPPTLLNDPVINKIADKHKKSTAQILLRFLLEKNIVVIPKSVTPSRIQSNFDLFSFKLDSNDLAEMDRLDQGEAGRIILMESFTGIMDHPEYPYGK